MSAQRLVEHVKNALQNITTEGTPQNVVQLSTPSYHAVPTLSDRTPMHLAAERGHTGTVEFLADKFKASVFDRTKVAILYTHD